MSADEGETTTGAGADLPEEEPDGWSFRSGEMLPRNVVMLMIVFICCLSCYLCRNNSSKPHSSPAAFAGWHEGAQRLKLFAPQQSSRAGQNIW